MTYVYLNSVPLIVFTKGIEIDPQMNAAVDPYVGTWGSNTTSLPKRGKHLSFKVYADAFNFEEVNSLRYMEEPVPFVSESQAELNSMYTISKFKILEEDRSQFKIDVELHEHTEWVVDSKKFANRTVDKSKAKPKCPKSANITLSLKKAGARLGQAVTVSGKSLTLTESMKITGKLGQAAVVGGNEVTLGTGATLNQAKKIVDCITDTSTKSSQLKDCAPLKKGNKNTECNEKLQRALKDNNEYIRYNGHNLVVDGVFGQYTEWAVREFQKKKKISPANGIADAKTLAKL